MRRRVNPEEVWRSKLIFSCNYNEYKNRGWEACPHIFKIVFHGNFFSLWLMWTYSRTQLPAEGPRSSLSYETELNIFSNLKVLKRVSVSFHLECYQCEVKHLIFFSSKPVEKWNIVWWLWLETNRRSNIWSTTIKAFMNSIHLFNTGTFSKVNFW